MRTIASGAVSWWRSIASADACRIASRSSVTSSGGRPPWDLPRSIEPRRGVEADVELLGGLDLDGQQVAGAAREHVVVVHRSCCSRRAAAPRGRRAPRRARSRRRGCAQIGYEPVQPLEQRRLLEQAARGQLVEVVVAVDEAGRGEAAAAVDAVAVGVGPLPAPTAVMRPSSMTMWPFACSVPASSTVAIAQFSMTVVMTRPAGRRRGSSRSPCSGTGCRRAPRGSRGRTGSELRCSRSCVATISPGVQNPHWTAPGLQERLLDRVQLVLVRREPLDGDDLAALGLAGQRRGTSTRARRRGRPSSEPHSPCSQAFLEPGSASRSRSTYSRLSPSQTPSTSRGSPLIVQVSLMRTTPTSAMRRASTPARGGGRSRSRAGRRSATPPRARARRTAAAPPAAISRAAVPVERAGDELLGLARAARRGGGRADAGADRAACRRRSRRRTSRRRSPSRCGCRSSRTADRRAAAGMWNAAISSSGSSTFRFGPVMNSSIGIAPLAARRRDLDRRVRRVQGREGVAGGGGGAEVAADRPAVADLRRADRPRRDRQARAARRPAPRSRACT